MAASWTALPLLLCLAACQELPGEDEGGTIGYDGTVAIVMDDSINDLSDRSALAAYEGRYGVSAADCDPDNRYMTEYIEVADVGIAYRGELKTLSEIVDDTTFTFSASDQSLETIRFDGDALIRWPDDRSMRTVYRRCA
ncbi:hypothetical protein [Sphingomicrobium sediminis]|uniref:Uncharacterized protein n=1 Tax=Sphingomicrobium sediminis TaxID=2950949 RepID=A0A9X2EJ59_9SPHN|nr:hypothetical protein [Sphingomicrobium sediminis]MCM8556319.1 hypothetical protein [Sphingomicrobium sediminis]